MIESEIDRLSRSLAAATTRRSCFRAGLALAAAAIGMGAASEAGATSRRPLGVVCRKGSDCISQICGAPDGTGRRRCSCASSQLVVAGRCVSCGQADQSCCSDGTCFDAGLSCSDENVCVHCGTRGEPCCAGDSCLNDNDVCFEGTCFACGNSGGICCADASCRVEGFGCTSTNTCEPCGTRGEPCCAGGVCQNDNDLCYEGTCFACGNSGGVCCAGGACQSPGYSCSSSNVCELTTVPV